MRLLIITQKVDINDDILGFLHRWLEKFAGKFEFITAVCLEKRGYNLPDNVRVLSLGKENRVSKLRYILNFYKYIWQERKNYDAVFVHMNPRYVLLGWPAWKILGKTVSLWYAHGHVSFVLKIADKLANVVFTSTSEGYRLKSKKLKVVGQGIDTEKFKPDPNRKIKTATLKLVSAGRISPSKDYETLIKAVVELENRGINNFSVEIAGQPATADDTDYFAYLKEIINQKGLNNRFKFVGSIPNRKLPEFLNTGDLFLNMGHTGSLDKAVLEAMATGLIILTCNKAFESVLGKYRDTLMHPKRDYQMLAEKIKMVGSFDTDKKAEIAKNLREIVVRNHSLDGWVDKIYINLRGDVDTKQAFNIRVKEKYHGNYEQQRWFANDLSKMIYEMTFNIIKKHFPDEQLNFKDYLELGPGPGTWTKFFIEKNINASFDLVDISEEMLKLAKDKLKNYSGIRYFESDFLVFNPDKNYDFFFSSRALEYIPDKDAVISKLSKFIREEGNGFIVTKTPRYFMHKISGRKVSDIHKMQITPAELKNLLKKYNFKNIRLYPATTKIPLIKSIILNKLIFRLISKFPLNFASQFLSESYCVKFSK